MASSKGLVINTAISQPKQLSHKPSKYLNSNLQEELKDLCINIARRLVDCQIKFLAIDFDNTLISEHTGGKWERSSTELASKVRPVFRHLIPELINHNIFVAVVTFSGQVALISQVLKSCFPKLHDKIPIRGNDLSWEYRGRGLDGGKQPHIASAAEIFETIYNVSINRSSTLLVDDDNNNIIIALQESVNAVRFYPEDPDRILIDLMNVAK